MLNEYALSALRWFFPFCLLLNGFGNFTLFPSRSLSQNVLSFVTAELRAQGAFLAGLHPLGLRSGVHTQEY